MSQVNTSVAPEQGASMENLRLHLLLESSGKQGEVFSSNIERVRMSLNPYGFDCEVHFSGFGNKELEEIFAAEGVIEATLTSNFADKGKRSVEEPLALKGVVRSKRFRGAFSEEVPRFYSIEFSDPAKGCWENHFPISIYANASMKEVIESQLSPMIKLESAGAAWGVLTEKHPIVAFALRYAETERVSFYSFLTWYLRNRGGFLEYDYKESTYSIRESKEGNKGGSPPAVLYEWEVTSPICTLPEAPRFSGRVLKHTADSLAVEERKNEKGYPSVRRDAFGEQPFEMGLEKIDEKVQKTLLPTAFSVQFEMVDFGQKVGWGDLTPGHLFSFKGDKEMKKEAWSGESRFKGKTFRLRSLYLEASKESVAQTPETCATDVAPYRLVVSSTVEPKEETYILRPPFTSPQYPFSIEGTVFCDKGEKEQTTYDVAKRGEAPEVSYLVTIPLAEAGREGGDLKISVPFTPDFTSGQYYFPACKGEKVLLSISLHAARMERVLDWQPLARLPSDTQGNQIVFASSGKDQSTILKHEYEEGTDSVLTLTRSSSDKKKQVFKMQEEEITLTVEEEQKKTVLLKLSEQGVTLSWKDASSDAAQEMVFDGKTITCTCKGAGGTSRFVQDAGSFTVTCKKFSVQADEIALEASGAIKQKGGSKVDIEASMANIKASKVALG